jgi:hypothetical protein
VGRYVRGSVGEVWGGVVGSGMCGGVGRGWGLLEGVEG